MPHIVMPLWSSADRFIVTSKGDDPPEMGLPVNESDQVGSLRHYRHAIVQRTV